jgi:hypothetical protein
MERMQHGNELNQFRQIRAIILSLSASQEA